MVAGKSLKSQIDLSLAREKDFSIPASDGAIIYGRANYAGDKPSSKLLVLSHGLTGHINEYIHLMARDHFNRAGYDVVRVSYYSLGDKARNLKDCTLKIHASDLNAVLAHFSGNYDKVFVAGHSYGGLTILFANPKVTAVSFWDSSFIPSFWGTEGSYIPELDCYRIGWGCHNLVGKAMVEEAAGICEEDAVTMAQALNAPAQVILAGDNSENEKRTLLFDSLTRKKDFYDVPHADHCFNKGKTVDDLLEKAGIWFGRF